MADSATADLVKQAIDHVRADLTKKGWTKIREVFGLPVDAAILGRHPAGGHWLFPIQVVQGRKPLPLVKFRRQAILDEAERSFAYVYLYTIWFTESGEMSHVSSGNLPDMPPR